MSEDRAFKAYNLHRQGLTDVEIGKRLGVTSMTVGNDLRRIGEAFAKETARADERLAQQAEQAFDSVVKAAKEQLLVSLRGESVWPMRRTWAAMLMVGAKTIDKLLTEAQAEAEASFVESLKLEPSLLRELKTSRDPSAPYVSDMLDMLGVKSAGGSE